MTAKSTPQTPLTKRQAEVLDFIIWHSVEWGYPPSVRDICDEFGFFSANGAFCHLRVLEKKGFIERDRHVARGIRIL